MHEQDQHREDLPQPALGPTPEPNAPADGGTEKRGQGSLLETLAEMQSKMEQFRELHEQAERRESELAARAQEIEQRKAEQDRLESELAQMRAQIESMASELDGKREQVEQQEQSLGQARAEVDRAREQLEAARSDLESRRAEVERLQADADEREKRYSEEHAKLSAQLREREAQIEAQTRVFEDRDEEIARQSERIESERRLLEEQEQRLEQRARQTSEEAARQAAELASKRSELEELERTLADERRKHQEELQRIEREGVATADQTAKALQDKVESLRGELEEAQSNRKTLESTLEEMRSRANQAQQRVTELESALESASSATGAGVDPAEIAKRDQAIKILRDRLVEAEGVIEQLKRARPANGAGGNDAFNESRRARLRKYKGLLKAQAHKINRAQAGLQKRQAECEQLLAHRTRLASVASELSKREKKLHATKARASAAAMVLYSTLTIGVLAVLSWAVTLKIDPGTYVASATIGVDQRGQQPDDQELAQWQAFHEELLLDPRLVELAAERMTKRGLTKVGTPPELRSRLTETLGHTSAEPGTLTIELRGEGAYRTKMELDTYITALKSVADSTRMQRSNALPTLITSAADVSSEPVEDQRLIMAGGILGGASLAALLFGVLIWSRLVRAKAKFEKEANYEASLDGPGWEPPSREAITRS